MPSFDEERLIIERVLNKDAAWFRMRGAMVILYYH